MALSGIQTDNSSSCVTGRMAWTGRAWSSSSFPPLNHLRLPLRDGSISTVLATTTRGPCRVALYMCMGIGELMYGEHMYMYSFDIVYMYMYVDIGTQRYMLQYTIHAYRNVLFDT